MEKPEIENLESEIRKPQSKSRTRKWRYVFLSTVMIFLLFVGNTYYCSQQRNDLIKRIEMMHGRIDYSRVITGNQKVDNYLLSTAVTVRLIKPFRKVFRIRISPNTVTDESLNELQVFREIKQLSLFNNQITDLTQLSGLAKLHTLYLNGNRITDLTPLAGLEKLEILDLGDNRITDLAGLEELKVLNLDNNQVTDLSPLAGLDELKHLVLSNNQVTDLSSLAGLENLFSLSLADNQITDLSPLAGLEILFLLDLSNNPNLTIEEINKFPQALPNCKITHNAKK